MSYAPDICIYHADCMDGFTAAWVVAQHYPNVLLFKARYGDLLPREDLVRGKDVLIVDFSFPLHGLNHIRDTCGANSVIVLDHHKTAQQELADLPPPTFPGQPGVYAVFDMDKSGARLAWEFCRPEHASAPPKIVEYVEDRDLWRWALPDSHQINAALGTYDQDMRVWTDLMARLMSPEHRAHLASEGVAILRDRARAQADTIVSTKRLMTIGGYLVRVVNAPFFMASDIGNLLSVGEPFAATYFDGATSRKFSLRSQADRVDVSEIAKRYGGGGHQHAAGFERPIGWEGDQP